jgi:type IV secretion system protein VirB4
VLSFGRERLVSDYIHIVDHVTDTMVLLDDGSVFGMFCVAGLPWETADAIDINKWHSDYNLALRNIAADTLILSVYQSRGMADVRDYPRGSFASDFAEALDRRYRTRIFDGLLYSNQLFLGVQIRPPRYAGELLGDQVTKRSRPADEAPEDRRKRLEDACALLQASLAAYRPRRLGCVVRGNALFSEIAEAIVLAMTGVWRPIGLTTGRLGNGMLSEQIITGREAIELRAAGWSHYAAVFGMREYPASTWPGMFAALCVAPYRSTLFQSFRFLSKADAHAVMNRKQNRMAAAGDKALSQQAELDVAADDLASNRFVMGDHALCLVAFADSMRALGNVATAAWRDLADCGAVVAREGAALEAAYFSMIPGNSRLRVRPGVISSRNFCAMAPLHNFPGGAEHGHWGAPIALFRTSGGTPYRFHWHVGDVGNTLVTGETGSGKSLLVGFLIAMTAARARIIALDHKRGWELLIRGMGGQYAVLGAGQPHFAPLKALDSAPRNIEFLTELIRGCMMMENGEPLTPEEDRRLALGVRTVMAMPLGERWIAEVRAFLGEDPNGAGARLDKWCWGNELGWVIDAPADAISLTGALHGLDTTALLDNPRARGPALLYLFHRIEQQLDGRPLLIPNDEGWRALLDDTFRPMIDKRLRTIRSFGGAFVFITQSPRDILDSGIAATLVEQCPTQIHMPNPRATEDDYVHGLKRTRAEFEALRELPKGSGLFLLCQGDKSTVAQLPLHGMDEDIAVLSGREATVRLMEEVVGKFGDDPADWLPELSRRMQELAA